MRTIEMYDNVPDGSTLELKAGPGDGAFTVTALFSTSGNVPDEKWKASEIRPGPKTHLLERGKAYILEIRLAFLGDVTVVLDARIRKPSGGIFSTPKVWEVTGSKGDQELRVLIIRTEA
jgi:hypothetical protein